MKTVYLISGFRGMGKDYLVKSLDISNYVAVSPVYNSYLPTTFRDMEHLCFARPLRDKLYEVFGMEINDEEYERVKDVKGIIPYEGSIRDFFKETAIREKSIDPMCYAKKVKEQIEKSEFEQFVVTDFRYPEEYECLKEHFKTITIRIHRKHGPRPNLDHPSENSLLSFSPDFYIFPMDTYEEDVEDHNFFYEDQIL